MGLFDKLFGFLKKPTGNYGGQFKLLSGYNSVYTSFGGSIYESELCRAAINAIATHGSKLAVDISGSAKSALRNKLKHGPNEWQTWGQFLYRLFTILYNHNTAFIVPIIDQYGAISGIYPVLPTSCEIVEYGASKVPYLRYRFSNGTTAAIELEYCGILTRFQYKSDLFGETNDALIPTMDLIKIQNKGIEESIKNSTSYKFMAKISNFATTTDATNERKRFSRENFAADVEGGGVLLFPNTYSDIRQIDYKPYTVDAEERKLIQENVFYYFGVNEDILMNKAFGDAWSAFYEGVIEPLAIQFSDVLTKMLFTFREQTEGNRVTATANRLQYMSNTDKLNVTAQLTDRGIFSINEAREVFNLAPVEGGDVRTIRGEYKNADAINETGGVNDADSENSN